MKTQIGVSILVVFFSAVVFGLQPAIEGFRDRINHRASELRVEWIGRRADEMMSVSAYIISAPESEERTEAARALYSLMNDYTSPEMASGRDQIREIPWDANVMRDLSIQLYGIGWPEDPADRRTGDRLRRVVVPPSKP